MTLLIITYVLLVVISFVYGYSLENRGIWFTENVKGIISLVLVMFSIWTIVDSIINHFWWGIPLVILIIFLFGKLGYRFYMYLLKNGSKWFSDN